MLDMRVACLLDTHRCGKTTLVRRLDAKCLSSSRLISKVRPMA